MWVVLVVAGVVLLFAAGLLLLVSTARPGDGVALLARDRVAILPLRGTITDDHLVLAQLREYRDDGSVKGYVIWIDSPGGEVAPSQRLYRELARLREEGYPVVAAIGSLGASGAYYAALGSDTIYAMPGSLVGSIGVLMQLPNARELLEKVGVQVQVVKSSDHKDLGSPFRDLEPAERELLQTVVDDVYDQFVEVIVAERDLARDSVLQIADGRLLSGRLAREYGLVDEEGDLHEAIATAGEMAGLGPEPRTVVREARRVTWLDLITSLARLTWAGDAVAPSLAGAVGSAGAPDGGPRLMYVVPYR